MITKTRYFTLTLVIIIIFVMFQFIGNSLDLFYDFDRNTNDSYQPKYNKTDADSAGFSSYMCFAHPEGIAAIVTDKIGDIPAVTDGCDYLKIEYEYYKSLSALDYKTPDKYSLIVIGDCKINLYTDIQIIKAFLANDVNVIFAVLPELNVFKSESLNNANLTQAQKNEIAEKNNLRREMRQILGVHTIEADTQKIDGITLFDGFLFGGKAIYENTEKISVPHISKLFASCKAYVMGILNNWNNEMEYRNEVLPHILWRNSYTGSYVFTVNADFMRYSSGIGFFTAMLSEMCEIFAYPVINAQTVLLENIPSLSEENSEELSKYYNQTTEYFFQTNVLPSINSVLNQNNFLPTYFTLSRFSYKDAVNAEDKIYLELMEFYLKQARKQNGEVGISGYTENGDIERLIKDLELFSRIFPDYKFTVLCSSGLSEKQYTELVSDGNVLDSVNTVVCPLKQNGDIEKIKYINDNVLIIPQTDNGYVHSDNDDITLRSIMTALGCSNMGIDGKNIVYPTDENMEWNALATDWARFTYTNWRPFRKFDKLTVTQADNRIRSYLSTSYVIRNEGDNVYISASEYSGECFLIIKATGKEIASVQGCTYKKTEEGTYLLTLTQAEAKISMKNLIDIKYS